MSSSEIQKVFDSLKGWVTRFTIDDKAYGGDAELENDERLLWHLETIGGVEGKTVLELGPLEGAHTKTFLLHNAKRVHAIEADINNFRKCLAIKDVFKLPEETFYLGDFREHIRLMKNADVRFDVVSAAGVLYHLSNPAETIFNLAEITDTVLVWSHVANDTRPSDERGGCAAYKNGKRFEYFGKWNHYGKIRRENFCGGVEQSALWLYREDLLRCFTDAGFNTIIEKTCQPNINGESVLFVARK